MSILYLDCFSGISGDMMVGALIDLGVDLEDLKGALRELGIFGYSIRVDRVRRKGIGATRFIVDIKEAHTHRPFSEIKALIMGSSLSEGVKGRSLLIFERLAQAEARVHGCSPEEVVFHEVGAVDSIIDIVATAVGLELLGIEFIYSSPLPLGSGFIETLHGRMPIPAPATLELLKGYPILPARIEAELTTPTGAAIVASLSRGRMPPMEVEAVGYGAGRMDLEEVPNLLRAVKGRVDQRPEVERLTVVECNIDDMNPLVYSHLMDSLFEAGALDVTLTPLQMKKNRPGVLLWVLCRADAKGKVMDTILSETTTIGVRSYEVERYSLERRIEHFDSPYGRVRVKVSGSGRSLHVQPEYEDCLRIARERGLPLRRILEEVTMAYRNATESKDDGCG